MQAQADKKAPQVAVITACDRVTDGESLVVMQAKKAKADKKAPQVAVIMACGSIVRGKGTIGGLSDGEEVASVPMCNLLQKAREDDQIRSVVLRIDSPGEFTTS